MYYEEFGAKHEKIIVMLHGANYVNTFAKQYVLAEKYCIIVPHLMGYGRETAQVFNTDAQIAALGDFIGGLGSRVTLVGFSLGAQLAYRLCAERPELLNAAVIVSPWLIKPAEMLEKVIASNEKSLRLFKKKPLCRLIGRLNGFSAEERAEFVEQMQRVKPETARSVADNGITVESVQGFGRVDFPVYAICGAKEQREVKDSIFTLAKLNRRCTAEVWEKAAHNIPMLFPQRLNELIEKAANTC